MNLVLFARSTQTSTEGSLAPNRVVLDQPVQGVEYQLNVGQIHVLMRTTLAVDEVHVLAGQLLGQV